MPVVQISPSIPACVEISPSPPVRGGRGQGEGGVRQGLPRRSSFFLPLRDPFWAPAGQAIFSGCHAQSASIVAVVPAPLTPTLSPRPAGEEGDRSRLSGALNR